ncbi:hypothetical protein [Micromonospora sp. CNB394]|uniref:hypothetical protein n=1 Tax=Micromonospora sp. CNB394 TaxID=1169151 RepID=UPI0003665E8D
MVNAFLWPLVGTPLGLVAPVLPDVDLRQEAEKLFEEAVGEARADGPGAGRGVRRGAADGGRRAQAR